MPKNPSHLALSGLLALRDIERVTWPAAHAAARSSDVHRAPVAVQDQRPPLRRAHGGDQVPERAERQPRVGVQGHPLAHRPAVEAVDGCAEVGLEAVQPELGDVGDAEQAGLGGVEVVRPVPAEGQ